MTQIIDRQGLIGDFHELGIQSGETIFVHSSLSSIGHVMGGADTVVTGLLSVLGDGGTLSAPAFTFDDDPALFDIATHPSGMGQISEAIRIHPRARRSAHRHHSVAAIGLRSGELTDLHGPSAWAADGPFWQLVTLDARILLLGVGYTACTFFHLIEQVVQVPYREWKYLDGVLREPDGSERPLPTQTFSQRAWSQGNDFNKFGAILEKKGMVQIHPVGNAIARLFKASDALHLGIAEYRKDAELFVKTGSDRTRLRDGIPHRQQQYVVDPDAVFKSPAGPSA